MNCYPLESTSVLKGYFGIYDMELPRVWFIWESKETFGRQPHVLYNCTGLWCYFSLFNSLSSQENVIQL